MMLRRGIAHLPMLRSFSRLTDQMYRFGDTPVTRWAVAPRSARRMVSTEGQKQCALHLPMRACSTRARSSESRRSSTHIPTAQNVACPSAPASLHSCVRALHHGTSQRKHSGSVVLENLPRGAPRVRKPPTRCSVVLENPPTHPPA